MPSPQETIVAFGSEPVPEELDSQAALQVYAAPALWALDRLARNEADHLDPLDLLKTGTTTPYLHWRHGDTDTWTSATELSVAMGSLVINLPPGGSAFIKGHFVTLLPQNHPVLLQMQNRPGDTRLRVAFRPDDSRERARGIQGSAYQEGGSYPISKEAQDTDAADAARILHGLFSTLATALG